MQIDVQSSQITLTAALRDHALARLTAALNQHAGRIAGIFVRLSDDNGPRGGIDQVCDITVNLSRGKPIRIRKRADDLYLAISDAADAAKQTVGRALGQLKRRR